MITFKLKSGIIVNTDPTGGIKLEADNSNIYITAAEMCYILQEYQDHYGGIPVKIDFSSFRGMYGS